jgi:hypothetical protein
MTRGRLSLAANATSEAEPALIGKPRLQKQTRMFTATHLSRVLSHDLPPMYCDPHHAEG